MWKKGKKGWIDLETANDRLSWDFIENTLSETGILLYLVTVIVMCVCTSSMQILVELPKNEICNLLSLIHISFSDADHTPSNLGRLPCLETLPHFAVGSDRGGSLQELQNLNKLRGSLTISFLEDVRDKEAKKANLQKKTKIQELEFLWSVECEISEKDEEVLEALEPHPEIKSLLIEFYSGENIPSWLSTMRNQSSVTDSSTILNSLVKLELLCCFNCEELPMLGHLPHLKFLKIIGFAKVAFIGNELYGIKCEKMRNGGRVVFPTLKSLYLAGMESLEEWRAPTVGDQGGATIPCLEELTISGCHQLTTIPINCLSSLKVLSVCTPILKGLPAGMIARLIELKTLVIEELWEFAFLNSIQGGDLPSLEVLVGSSAFLPDQLQHLTALKSLSIINFNEVEALPEWLANLSSLYFLSIENCEKMNSLPSAEAIQRMSDLISLSISGCPYLGERCAEGSGSEWYKISHLQDVVIHIG